MNKTRLEEIEDSVTEIARRINMPSNYLPTFGYSEDFGRPHIEIGPKSFEYIVMERGAVREAKMVDSVRDLLYLIFESATSSMAWDYERLNRIEGQDARRLAFEKKLELLNGIDKEFGERWAKELKAILAVAPYTDDILD